jgi:hypothetical protein
MPVPIVVGSGMRLFDDVTDQVALELVESRALSTGMLSVRYRPQSAWHALAGGSGARRARRSVCESGREVSAPGNDRGSSIWGVSGSCPL